MLAQSYGATPDGMAVELYRLGDEAGLRAHIITYGGTLVRLEVPDRNGVSANVVLSLASLGAYIGQESYLCALIGRFANRIGGASFALGGVDYRVSNNDGGNCLHGGRVGFNKAVWRVVGCAEEPEPRLTLRHESPDGDQSFPGALAVEVTYSISAGNTLRIDYRAQTDRPTVLNLTNHAYFNLAGAGNGDILDHEMTIAADRFTPTDAQQIPTGEMRPVAGTAFDFRESRPIGARIGEPDHQLQIARGYDHNFVLARAARDAPHFAARAYAPSSGRILELRTTQPGVQFYTGNHLDGTLRAAGGNAYGPRAGFCLETQHFPDSPNQPDFPSTLLRPGEAFASTTEYRFAVE
jgi:aldose 1-epimerase